MTETLEHPYDHLIPDELKALKQWVLWRYETVNNKDGTTRQTKIPYQIDGTKAESDDPTTCNTYDAVCAVYMRYKDDPRGYNGIGFVFTKDDHYTGIDLDDAIDEDGQTKEWAAKIIGSFNSYTETSPK